MVERKMKQEHEVLSVWDLDGSLVSIRDLIQLYIDQYGESATMSPETEWDYDCERTVFHINYEREETDAEMNKRLKMAEKARERRKMQKAKDAVKKEKKERAELARLTKRYGEG